VHQLVPPGCNSREYASAALLCSVFKKFQDEIDQESADKAAFAKFITMNERSATYERPEDPPFYTEELLGEFRQTLWEFFNPEGFPLLTHSSIEEGVDFGPGKAPGTDQTSFLFKIGHSALTAPNPLTIELFYEWVKSHPLRLDSELSRLVHQGVPRLDKGVEITPVPKTTSISRLVKPEPLLGMFFQKGIQAVLERRLKSYFGIDLSEQPLRNQELAREGSLNGSYSTIDLESASDTLSLKLCREFIDRPSMAWLELFRSCTAKVQGEITQLHMMCTMGNAFCFPLQTVIFASVVRAVYRVLGLPYRIFKGKENRLCNDESGQLKWMRHTIHQKNWGVFGDDIIVVDRATRVLIEFLTHLGFVVNNDKTFTCGPFRESCGADFFSGINVRGVYIKSLKTEQDRAVAFNRLAEWSAQHGVPLTRALALLRTSVPMAPLVPPWENIDAGLRVPEAVLERPLVLTRKGSDFHGSIFYKRWVPRESSLHSNSRAWSTLEEVNPSAVFLTAVKGSLRGGRVTVLNYRTLYDLKWGVAPAWDWIPPYDPRKKYEEDLFKVLRECLGCTQLEVE
jgi:hypothetical protein